MATSNLLRRAVRATAAVILVSGCGRDKEIAEKDVRAAEVAIAAVRGDAMAFTPERLKSVNDTIEKAKDDLISGDYRAAMKVAEHAMAEAQGLGAVVTAKKAELTTAFTEAQASLPKTLGAIQAKLDQILASKKLPAGLDAGRLAVLKAELPGWTKEWDTAVAAFKAGDLLGASRKATELKARAADALTIVGLPPA